MQTRKPEAGFEHRAKVVVKQLMPRPIMRLLMCWRTKRVQQGYAHLSLSATFDRIYTSNAWGGTSRTLNSGTGSQGRYAEEYCLLMGSLLKTYHITTVADLGCGDFYTGRKIAALVEHYTGVDIARPVIDSNARQFGDQRTHFLQADLTHDSLPPADAAVLRQVLQHLTNAEACAVLDNVLHTYALAFVTEHLYIGRDSKPNVDIPHGPGTRVPMKSGICIDLPPFSLKANVVGDIQYATNEVLRTWVVENKSASKQ